ncbi:hypothetical protein Lal_00014841 [Lupinus albus]|nr:hypothetical protein Lal_00014841 [Lupinus albus]
MVQRLVQLEIVGAAEFERLVRARGREQAHLRRDVVVVRRILGGAARVVLEVVLQVGLAHAQGVHAVAVRVLVDGDVGHDAARLDRAAAGRVVAGRRQLDGRLAGQRADRLHGTLAERPAADDGRALVVLQRPRDDLRRGRRPRVYEHDHRNRLEQFRHLVERIAAAAEQVVLGAAVELCLRIFQLAVRRDDLRILRQERGRHADGALQQAARVVAQVEHEALQVRLLARQRGQFLREILDGRLLELRHAHPRVAGRDDPAFYAFLHDLVAHDRERQGRRRALAQHRQHDLRVRFAAHALDGVVEVHVLHGRAIHVRDQVARLDAGAGGRRILDRGDDAHIAFVALVDLDAEADEFAFRPFAQFAVGLAVEVGRVRVERAYHAGNALREQLAVFHRLDVVGTQRVVGVGQLVQALDGHAVDRLAGQGRVLHRDADPEDHTECDEGGVLEAGAHGRWRNGDGALAGRQGAAAVDDARKQRQLAIGRVVPAEPLRVAAGGGVVRVVLAQRRQRVGDALRRAFLHQHARFRPGDHFRRAPHVRRDDGRAAGHRFEQHVGPAFAAGGEHHRVGRVVVVLELGLRDGAEEFDAVRHAQARGQRFQFLALGADAGDEQFHVRQHRQRPDGQIVRLARVEHADGNDGEAVDAQLRARGGAVQRDEALQVDAVAQRHDAVARDAEADHFFAQRLAHRDHAGRVVGGPHELLSRQRELRNQVNVGTAGRDDDGFVEVLAQHHRGDAVRIKIVRVDDVEVIAFIDDASDFFLARLGHQPRRGGHADLRDDEVAGVRDRDVVAGFRCRHLGKGRVVAEARVLRREPGHGRDDLRFDLAAGEQVAQSGFDKDAVAGFDRVRKEGTECKELHRRCARGGMAERSIYYRRASRGPLPQSVEDHENFSYRDWLRRTGVWRLLRRRRQHRAVPGRRYAQDHDAQGRDHPDPRTRPGQPRPAQRGRGPPAVLVELRRRRQPRRHHLPGRRHAAGRRRQRRPDPHPVGRAQHRRAPDEAGRDRRQVDRAGRHRGKSEARHRRRAGKTRRERGVPRRQQPRIPERRRRHRRLHEAGPHRGRLRRRRRGQADAPAVRAVQPQPRKIRRDGHPQRRADEVRGERHAGHPHQLHERAGQPVRTAGRRHRSRAPGHRHGPAHRPGLPVRRHGLWRFLLPERRQGADQDRVRPRQAAAPPDRDREGQRRTEERAVQQAGALLRRRAEPEREDDRAVGPVVQAEHGRHARSAEPHPDQVPVRRGRQRGRVRPGRQRGSAARARRRAWRRAVQQPPAHRRVGPPGRRRRGRARAGHGMEGIPRAGPAVPGREPETESRVRREQGNHPRHRRRRLHRQRGGGAPDGHGAHRGRLRQFQRLLRPGAEAPPRGSAVETGRRAVRDRGTERRRASCRAVRAREAGARRAPGRPGRRALFAEEPGRVRAGEPRRVRPHAGSVPQPQGRAPAVREQQQRLRRQRQDAVQRGRRHRRARVAVCRHEKVERADGPLVQPPVRHPDDGPAFLYGLRSVGPPGHGVFQLRAQDAGGRTHPRVRRGQAVPRLHLYRRHRRRRRPAAVQADEAGRQAAARHLQHRQPDAGAGAGFHPYAGRRIRRQGATGLPADAAGRRPGHARRHEQAAGVGRLQADDVAGGGLA